MFRPLSYRATRPSAAFSTALGSSLRLASSQPIQQQRIFTSTHASIKPLVEEEVTLYDYMINRIRGHDPNAIGVIDAATERPYSFAELLEVTNRIAQVLYHAGNVRTGDVVSICTLNSAVYGPMVYGILQLGAIISPVNPSIQTDSLAYHFKTNRCKVILGEKALASDIEAAAKIVEKETGQRITVLYPEDFLKLTDRLEIPKEYLGRDGAALDDTVFIPFSSGTTGLPKGVQLTNRSLVHNTEQATASFGFTHADATLMILPYFHIYGFTCGLNCFLSVGGTQVVMKQFNVAEYARLIEKHRITFNLVAPPVFVSLVKNYDSFKHRDLSTLRGFISGAAPLGGEVEALFRQLFPHVAVAQAYGTTEMSPLLLGPRWSAGGAMETPVRGAAGAILPDTEFRIVKVDDSQQSGEDKSAGIDCELGESGEIWVRGPQMMKGYLKQEDTDKTMQDGWYRTGDIGVYDVETGYLTITDRLKELIKYKGYQVSPASMEAMLLSHPWVQDCLVVGVPDPRDISFEMPRALVVLKKDLSTAEAVQASDSLYHYMVAHNAPHKRLHGGVRIVDAIPRNAAGKVLRRSARTEEVAYMKRQADLGAGGGDKSPSQSSSTHQKPQTILLRVNGRDISSAAAATVTAAAVAYPVK